MCNYSLHYNGQNNGFENKIPLPVILLCKVRRVLRYQITLLFTFCMFFVEIVNAKQIDYTNGSKRNANN